MPCYRPLEAFRRKGGGITFDQKPSASVRPLQLPCGQCHGCRLSKAQEWALRCVHEAQMHDANCFLTLTYDDDHLPVDGSLDVSHWQKFAKRVRKQFGPFRFLHCGEYGRLNLRPHYHACVFGLDFSEDRELFRGGDTPLFVSKKLSVLWPLGFSTVGALTPETAMYVARYTLKKLMGKARKDGRIFMDYVTECGYSVKSEYATMSRGGRAGAGGLGTSWIEKFKSDVYPSDEVVSGGKVFRPPRFYDGKLDDEVLEELKEKRRRSVNREDVSEERLKVREQVALARAKFQARRL